MSTNRPLFDPATGFPVFEPTGAFRPVFGEPAIYCALCDPPLRKTYTVTITDCTRPSAMNGDWGIEWTESCIWYGSHAWSGNPGYPLNLRMSYGDPYWELYIWSGMRYYKHLHFTSEDTPCATQPTEGTWVLYSAEYWPQTVNASVS